MSAPNEGYYDGVAPMIRISEDVLRQWRRNRCPFESCIRVKDTVMRGVIEACTNLAHKAFIVSAPCVALKTQPERNTFYNDITVMQIAGHWSI